ncbi:MAG: platelet-activating factor acetylhydrolase IB subunit [Kiritimatiellae bacterium]|nr:platelet-activating factor acetylhydrolase IB subunit [Kiritimatiellia bacterium]MDD5519870.1 platelet-activating factor acetylhydrolase IB subunit [Kiritimatiellia bacterium]
MKFNRGLVSIVASIGLLHGICVAQTNSLATTSVGKENEAWWKKRHEAKVELAKQGNVDLLWIGDSITHGFEGGGKAMWEKYYAPRHALNIGFSADRTEHVLWRLDNGEIDGISPKLAIIMLGTNNTGHRKDKPEEIAEGIKLICEKLRTKLPNMKVLVLGIFPRGEKSTDFGRMNNDEANKLIAKLVDDKNIFFLNINDKFLGPDGVLSKEIMPDFLHPNPKGYQIWAETIEPTVAKLMGEEKK